MKCHDENWKQLTDDTEIISKLKSIRSNIRRRISGARSHKRRDSGTAHGVTNLYRNALWQVSSGGPPIIIDPCSAVKQCKPLWSANHHM